MLKEGIIITGIGELQWCPLKKIALLKPPKNGKLHCLTTMSVNELYNKLEDERKCKFGQVFKQTNLIKYF